LSKTIESDLDKFQRDIQSIYYEAHHKIPPLRKEAYKLLATWKKIMKLNKNDEIDEDENLKKYYYDEPLTEKDDYKKLLNFAIEASECARKFQEATQKLTGMSPSEVLRVTTRAGVLLYYIEQVLKRYDGLKTKADSNVTSSASSTQKKSPPTNVEVKILSQAMTAAATARDQIIAANGFVKNLKEIVGSKERGHLLVYGLLPTLGAYFLFYVFTYGIQLVPSEYRIYWEVVFWSLFGAISISFITISEDVNRDDFDPRHLNKYEYKIAVAPFIATVLVFFVSQFGIVSGDISIKLDLANPNFPVIILLSFLFGFFGKRSLDLLDKEFFRSLAERRSTRHL
jgi:hypothetical protein